MKIKHFLSIMLVVMCLFACTTKQRNSLSGNKGIELKYARGFTMEKTNNYKIITVLNPWKEGEVYDKYYLVKDTATQVPDDGKKIMTPLKTLVANSATHLEFIQLIDEIDQVTGVCNAQYIYSPTILRRVKEGKTKDLGDAFNLDIENLMLLRPQAVMTSAYNAEDENSKKLEQCRLPVIFNIEWQEKTLLGRAEWIKFVAAFFDKEELADSIFNQVEKRYNDAKKKAATLPYSPTVLSGQDFRGTWSMPAGKSFNAQLFRDAGSNYFYANNKETGSIFTNIENALINFSKANIWVGVQANTLEELGKTDAKYKLFQAFKNGNVYNYNNRINANGGNDYWESGVARPDLLLMDMIKVFHPSLFPEYTFTYMKKLE